MVFGALYFADYLGANCKALALGAEDSLPSMDTRQIVTTGYLTFLLLPVYN